MTKQNPSHYDFGNIQVLDLTQHLDFCTGNVVKYCARAGRKDGESKLDDLLKAKVYLDKAIEKAIDDRARKEALGGSVTLCSGCATPNTCKAHGCLVMPPQAASDAVPDCIVKIGTCRREAK
jgi:hypothetical protein